MFSKRPADERLLRDGSEPGFCSSMTMWMEAVRDALKKARRRPDVVDVVWASDDRVTGVSGWTTAAIWGGSRLDANFPCVVTLEKSRSTAGLAGVPDRVRSPLGPQTAALLTLGLGCTCSGGGACWNAFRPAGVGLQKVCGSALSRALHCEVRARSLRQRSPTPRSLSSGHHLRWSCAEAKRRT